MARVPVVRIGEILIAAVQEDLYDRDALALQTDLSTALEQTGAHGVLLDISVVETVDSFLGRMLNDTAALTRLLGAHTVLVGMQPAVAITLVELGLDLKGIRTSLDAQKGLKLLQTLIANDSRNGRARGR